MDAGGAQPAFRTVPRGYHRDEVDVAVARMETVVADAWARVAVIEASTKGLELQVAQARGRSVRS